MARVKNVLRNLNVEKTSAKQKDVKQSVVTRGSDEPLSYEDFYVHDDTIEITAQGITKLLSKERYLTYRTDIVTATKDYVFVKVTVVIRDRDGRILKKTRTIGVATQKDIERFTYDVNPNKILSLAVTRALKSASDVLYGSVVGRTAQKIHEDRANKIKNYVSYFLQKGLVDERETEEDLNKLSYKYLKNYIISKFHSFVEKHNVISPPYIDDKDDILNVFDTIKVFLDTSSLVQR